MIEKDFEKIEIAVYPVLGETPITKVVSIDRFSGTCQETVYASPAETFSHDDAVVIGRFYLFEQKLKGEYSWNQKMVVERLTLRVVGKSIDEVMNTATMFKTDHPQYQREFSEGG